ncbi:predicted protein [Histoplasma capsulatum G186AR]|uniref:Uncharacterized protein n=1 Tax=Ajellomyces capsulatus (strain G186AR / H82 / ATCC MYA-2454 / RMSCC 2432) TaxID=447093 RepID=C0NW47_AJECG|nr:uncharacterized protein HCBG_07377 [Histoplasma capsulatum G186AR]EEH04151.1 predicted protein [Histoplasma capsulatum G186AR]
MEYRRHPVRRKKENASEIGKEEEEDKECEKIRKMERRQRRLWNWDWGFGQGGKRERRRRKSKWNEPEAERGEGVLARKEADQAETARRPKAVGGQGTSGGQEISLQ